MTSAEDIEELLDQIQNQTGIRFSITDSQIDDEELLITLKNMLRAGHSSTSKEGFLRGLLLGLLSDQEIAEGIHRFHLEKNGYFSRSSWRPDNRSHPWSSLSLPSSSPPVRIL